MSKLGSGIVAAFAAIAISVAAMMSGSLVVSIIGLLLALFSAYVVFNMARCVESPLAPDEVVIHTVVKDTARTETAESLKDMVSRVNTDTREMMDTSAMDRASSDDKKTISDFKAMLNSLLGLLDMPEFTQASANDRNLVISLSSSYIPDAWSTILDSVRYLSLGGTATDKAHGNLQEVSSQIAIINEVVARVKASMVDDVSTRVAIGTEYLKTRINDVP